MAAAKKPTAYVVVGAAAVIRKDKAERYLYRGATVSADALDEGNAKHLLAAGLIEAAEEDAPEQSGAEK